MMEVVRRSAGSPVNGTRADVVEGSTIIRNPDVPVEGDFPS